MDQVSYVLIVEELCIGSVKKKGETSHKLRLLWKDMM